MGIIIIIIPIFLIITISVSSSFTSTFARPAVVLSRGSSLYVENKDDDVLVSPNGLFTAGFHKVGYNAYGFAVWFSEEAIPGDRTVVWMANRDAPVNGKHSKLSLREDGNLVLVDATKNVIWSTHDTRSIFSSSVQLQLNNTGNLVLQQPTGLAVWQSFDHPTDTLLPNQPFTKNTTLVSSTTSKDYSSGYYKLFFDNDSILRLLFDCPQTTTVYWPDPKLLTYQARRFQYIDTRTAILDSDGRFNSSDGFTFISADYGRGPHRIMKLDPDGNLRVYSLVGHERRVQWQAISHSCMIHGTCGPNSLCTSFPHSPKKCSCLHGYKMVNPQDWSYGCKPEFHLCTQDECDFIRLRHVEFYGYDIQWNSHYTLDACKKDCLQNISCSGFQFGWNVDKGYYYCFLKTSLRNGYQMGYNFSMYIKLPKRLVSSFSQKNTIIHSSLSCPRTLVTPIPLRSYENEQDFKQLRLMLVFGCAIGFIEIISIVIFWYYTSKTSSMTDQIYFPAPTGFRKFTYSELKKASCNFREEIGRGGACIVYKGRLSDNRIAAIKRLKNTNHQGEAEFQAEVSTIGKVNHMNLIQMWGYCAQGKHRLVVYEYMENGSLAKNLGLGNLDWKTRFNIALGTAKGLAYLHEDCLEWVLHCDVKPHNILLDVNYNPKVADFGLSKPFDRSDSDQCKFSMIRGTRGYMAPEWVHNLPITSKVDVFSYGVVILEIMTGRSPAGMHQTSNENGKTAEFEITNWVRDKINKFDGSRTTSWVDEIVDPSISGEYDQAAMENLIRIALQCVEEDREARPSMSKVVDLLLHI